MPCLVLTTQLAPCRENQGHSRVKSNIVSRYSDPGVQRLVVGPNVIIIPSPLKLRCLTTALSLLITTLLISGTPELAGRALKITLPITQAAITRGRPMLTSRFRRGDALSCSALIPCCCAHAVEARNS